MIPSAALSSVSLRGAQSRQAKGALFIRVYLLLATWLAACDAADAPRPATHIHNAAQPEDGVCDVRLVDDLAIGVADQPATHAIGEIIAYAIGDDGTIYVLDYAEPAVRIYNEDGTVRRMVGIRGRGPGEFERPYRIALRADEFVVYDLQLNRLARFDSTGRHISTGSLPFRPESDIDLQLAADRRVFVAARAGVDSRSRLIHELDERYQLVRSFGEPADSVDLGSLDQGAIDLGEDGSTWFSPAADYEIRRYDADGTLRMSIRREHDFDFRPRPYVQEQELPGGLLAIGFDQNRAISTQLVLDDSGYLWRFVRDGEKERVVVDAFTGTGRFVFSRAWSLADAPSGIDRKRRFYRISREAGYPQLVRLRATGMNETGSPCGDS